MYRMKRMKAREKDWGGGGGRGGGAWWGKQSENEQVQMPTSNYLTTSQSVGSRCFFWGCD